MKRDKRFWYWKRGRKSFHAIYPVVKNYDIVTVCQLKVIGPWAKIVGALDGVWDENEEVPRCGNCMRRLKI